MAFPNQAEIEAALLHALALYPGGVKPAEIYDAVAAKVPEMTPEERQAELRSGHNRFNNRVQWCRQSLVERGLLDNTQRGVWKLTPNGHRAASEVPTLANAGGDRPPAAVTTPSLLSLIQRHEKETREALREALGSLDPYEFEEVAGQLLRAMGFKKVQVTRKSGDGGIDGSGLLKLGVVTVQAAFQCKRQQQPVGRPAVDAFRGAIQGRFDQGIFITTSRFTSEASGESIRAGSVPIIMVDGEGLVDLMIEHQIGVVNRPLMIPLVDEDFFGSRCQQG